MVSCQLIFAFIFVIKLIINVVSSSAITPAQLISIKVDSGYSDVIHGLYHFGESVPNEVFLPPVLHIKASPYKRGNRVREHIATIKSPNGERITHIKLQSMLGDASNGERVHEIGYGPNHETITIMFWSKPNHAIDFTVNVFGI